MSTKKGRNRDDELFTYTEFKEKFFPGANINLDDSDSSFTKETFMEVLKKISRPVGKRDQVGKGKKKTPA